MPEDYTFGVGELNRELGEGLGPGEEFTDEDFEEIKIEGIPERPSFPILVFILAIFKDFVDLISFGLLGIFTNIVAWLAIRMYLYRKVGFIKRWLYKRFIFTLILEFIPFINMIPQWTIFVLRAHAKEKKRVDEVLTAIEKLLLRYAGAPKFVERFV